MEASPAAASAEEAGRLMRTLELMAPARTAEIGIAAIDCGADAVYIAGPSFGARQDAGNPVGDIADLCSYAHRFGARIFATVNTLLFDEELPAAKQLVQNLKSAGVDAVIAQDLAVIRMCRDEGITVHASTQCSIRDASRARFFRDLGCGRIVLDRHLSLDEVRSISASLATGDSVSPDGMAALGRDTPKIPGFSGTPLSNPSRGPSLLGKDSSEGAYRTGDTLSPAAGVEIEFFVHGAMCVCFNGQCYLSERLSGRSANRGACIQACRSPWDVRDEGGRLLKNGVAALSMKDLNLIERLEDLARAGVDSFKIEGRLKSISYVRNVVRAYSDALDAIVNAYPDEFRRASFGHPGEGFAPDLQKSFNRGYSEFCLDGGKGEWSSMDAPGWAGEPIGTVASVRGNEVTADLTGGITLHNGDGLSYKKDGLTGFRADVVSGNKVHTDSPIEGLRKGMTLYRNTDMAFEKSMESNLPKRYIPVSVTVKMAPGEISLEAVSEDGRRAKASAVAKEAAKDPDALLRTVRNQISKHSGHYLFSVSGIESGQSVPFFPIGALNALRRELEQMLSGEPVRAVPLSPGREGHPEASKTLTYKDNVTNTVSESIYRSLGAETVERSRPVEYMHTRYCLRNEMGLCPKQDRGETPSPLYITNGGNRFRLEFDCHRCEMTVKEG